MLVTNCTIQNSISDKKENSSNLENNLYVLATEDLSCLLKGTRKERRRKQMSKF